MSNLLRKMRRRAVREGHAVCYDATGYIIDRHPINGARRFESLTSPFATHKYRQNNHRLRRLSALRALIREGKS